MFLLLMPFSLWALVSGPGYVSFTGSGFSARVVSFSGSGLRVRVGFFDWPFYPNVFVFRDKVPRM